MAKLGITLMIMSIVAWLVLLIWGLIYYNYWYNVKVGQYISLSDDASTADVKLQYIEKYSASIKENIARNDARYIFKQERLTRDKQLQIIDTLITRLKETSSMKPDSFEYQQAMAQISGQEYDHTLLEINGIIHGCWLRQGSIGVFGLWFSWIPCLLVFIFGFALWYKSDF